MALKARREQESKIHAQLHSNLHALTLLSPPSDDFRRVFVKDMFVKNNKAAFQQVVYYLLSMLDPEGVKTKIPSWPIYSPKQEAQFRGEVMKYVNELNVLYEFANVPLIMTSHLISPGGYKFAKFVLKLSQLVMSVVLQRDLEVKITFLYPLKSSKNPEIARNSLGRLKQKSRVIEREVVQTYVNCDLYVKWAHCEAKKIVDEKKAVREKLKDLKYTSNTTISPHNSFDLAAITKKLAYSSSILSLCLQVEELKSYLFANEIVLKHSDSELNLVEYFTMLSTFLATIRLQKPYFSSYYLKGALETTSKTNTWLLMMCKVFEEVKEKSVRLSEVVEGAMVRKGGSVCTYNDGDSNEVLAVPLAASPL